MNSIKILWFLILILLIITITKPLEKNNTEKKLLSQVDHIANEIRKNQQEQKEDYNQESMLRNLLTELSEEKTNGNIPVSAQKKEEGIYYQPSNKEAVALNKTSLVMTESGLATIGEIIDQVNSKNSNKLSENQKKTLDQLSQSLLKEDLLKITIADILNQFNEPLNQALKNPLLAAEAVDDNTPPQADQCGFPYMPAPPPGAFPTSPIPIGPWVPMLPAKSLLNYLIPEVGYCYETNCGGFMELTPDGGIGGSPCGTVPMCFIPISRYGGSLSVIPPALWAKYCYYNPYPPPGNCFSESCFERCNTNNPTKTTSNGITVVILPNSFIWDGTTNTCCCGDPLPYDGNYNLEEANRFLIPFFTTARNLYDEHQWSEYDPCAEDENLIWCKPDPAVPTLPQHEQRWLGFEFSNDPSQPERDPHLTIPVDPKQTTPVNPR